MEHLAILSTVTSLPSRGAWIEIGEALVIPMLREGVAPLAGSVDRNGAIRTVELDGEVAPLAGSVDRNGDIVDDAYWGSEVAPRAGSVDRNSITITLRVYLRSRLICAKWRK